MASLQAFVFVAYPHYLWIDRQPGCANRAVGYLLQGAGLP